MMLIILCIYETTLMCTNILPFIFDNLYSTLYEMHAVCSRNI